MPVYSSMMSLLLTSWSTSARSTINLIELTFGCFYSIHWRERRSHQLSTSTSFSKTSSLKLNKWHWCISLGRYRTFSSTSWRRTPKKHMLHRSLMFCSRRSKKLSLQRSETWFWINLFSLRVVRRRNCWSTHWRQADLPSKMVNIYWPNHKDIK